MTHRRCTAQAQPNPFNFKFLPFYMVSYLPLRVLYGVSAGLSFLLYHIFKYRRGVVRQNLNTALVDRKLKDIKQIEKQYYKHMCNVIAETIKALTLSSAKMKDYISFSNIDLINQSYKNKHNLMLYATHQGNWEWFLAFPLFTQYKVYAIYQPLSSPYFDELLKTIRTRFGVECIPSNKAFQYMSQSRNSDEPALFILIGDQCPNIKSTLYWTQFMNQNTAFFCGGARLALKYNLDVLYAFIEKKKRGTYQMHFQKIEENSVEEITESYSNHLEKSIIQSPSTWLWSHRRWKLKQKCS